MGQYYRVVNLDKRQYIDPYVFGDGVKLMEFGCSGNGTMTALAVLLASSNGMGGGDLHLGEKSKWKAVPGSWAGDRIVVAGDYDDDPKSPGFKVYDMCNTPSSPMTDLLEASGHETRFVEISYHVLGCLLEDPYFLSSFLTLPEQTDNPMWSNHMDNEQRASWAKARPGEPFPRDIK